MKNSPFKLLNLNQIMKKNTGIWGRKDVVQKLVGNRWRWSCALGDLVEQKKTINLMSSDKHYATIKQRPSELSARRIAAPQVNARSSGITKEAEYDIKIMIKKEDQMDSGLGARIVQRVQGLKGGPGGPKRWSSHQSDSAEVTDAVKQIVG